jgi:hypothetical protein
VLLLLDFETVPTVWCLFAFHFSHNGTNIKILTFAYSLGYQQLYKIIGKVKMEITGM